MQRPDVEQQLIEKIAEVATDRSGRRSKKAEGLRAGGRR